MSTIPTKPFHVDTIETHEEQRAFWAQHVANGRADEDAFAARLRSFHGKDLPY